MPQFSLTVVPTLVQGLQFGVENHEIPKIMVYQLQIHSYHWIVEGGASNLRLA